MSSDVWKIGQEMNAKNMYNDIRENGLGGCFFLKSEIIAVKQLTNICNQMSEAYDEVIDDQNDYLIEVEADATDFENLKEDINEKIKTLYKEIKELEQKEQAGTITEEEQKDLENKKGELKVLMADSDTQIEDKTKSAKEKGEKRIQEHKSKMDVAKDYGEVTVEKGTPLAETKVKTKSFWRSIFGGTGRDKKEAGDRAVEAGNNLLDKVNESAEIDKNIEKNYKRIKA